MEKRRLIFNDNVDSKTVFEIIEKILKYNDEDNEKDEKEKNYIRQPIELIINSGGGNCWDGYALVSAIQTSKTPVHTICLGRAMSMALVIFLSGHKRFAHKYSTFMYHQVYWGSNGKLEHLRNVLGEGDRLGEMYDDLVVSRTVLSKEKLDKVKEMQKDWYISGKEALKYGIVDELL